MNFKNKLGIIGYGNMASAILEGISLSKYISMSEIVVYDHNEYKCNEAMQLGVNIAKNAIEVIKSCKYVLLAIKPQGFSSLATEIAPYTNNNIVISILAGTTRKTIKQGLTINKVARAMPNTPAFIQMGVTGVDCEGLNNLESKFVKQIFLCIGEIVEIDEGKINNIIAISGSGPAYVYEFIKGMVEKAKKIGFSEEESKKLVVSTILGTTSLYLKSDEKIDSLCKKVCSKGGTTIEAVKVFESEGIVQIIDKAIQACYDRAKELSEGK